MMPLISCLCLSFSGSIVLRWQETTDFRSNLYVYTAIFTESFRRTIQAWGYHGYLPKSKTSTAQNQTQLQGDNIRNDHAQLSKVLHSFRNLHHICVGSHFPWALLEKSPWTSFQPCILFVIQDMQEGDMLCGHFGSHTRQIQRQSRSCNVNYKDLASQNHHV